MNPIFEPVFKQLNSVILGKAPVLKQLVASILADGHVLLEDVPGVGKTTLAGSLAAVLGLRYQRVQFTNDMLPADLLGVNVFMPAEGAFKFHPGPVFNQFVLADEINRASPKVQSALLEAMEERQVSVDGKTYRLPQPFLVVATQNPSEQLGTFPLPESQLDRFMMRLSMGYPAEEAEKALYRQGGRRHAAAAGAMAAAGARFDRFRCRSRLCLPAGGRHPPPGAVRNRSQPPCRLVAACGCQSLGLSRRARLCAAGRP